MAKCFFCDLQALEGHLTCGLASCPEADARAHQHSERRWNRRGRPASESLRTDRREREGLVYNSKQSVNEPIKQERSQGLAPSVCGAENGYMKVRCALPYNHEGDLHATGTLCWRRGERPRYMDDELKAKLEPAMEAESDGDRLATLTQVLVTVRSQMLGLGTGLENALSNMPRAVDQNAVRGLVAALTHIVGHLDSFKLSEAEAGFRKEARVGADSITASAFDRGSPMQRSGQMSKRAAAAPEVLPTSSEVMAAAFERRSVRTLPQGHREPVVHWRGSVSDLATDLEPLLSEDQTGELASELLRRRASAGLSLPFPNPLRELVDELQGRLASAEQRLAQVEAKAGEPVLEAFVQLIVRERGDAGRLDDVDIEVLAAMVGGIVGVPFVPPSPDRVGKWGPACEKLERLGFLHGYSERYRPTVRGMRHGLVLLGDRHG